MKLKDLLLDKITYDKCSFEVSNDGLELQYVPKELKDYKICRLALQQNGCAIQFVPEQLLTEELCIIAVTKSGMALKYIPKKNQTTDICLIAINKNDDYIKYSKYPMIRSLNYTNLISNANKEECHICFKKEDSTDNCRCKLVCGHIFHIECISNWINNSNNCPYCNKDIECRWIIKKI
jgi:hypothetical protein